MTAAIFDDVFHPDDIAFGGDGRAQCLFHGLGVGAGPFAVYAGTGEPVHVALFVEEDLSRHVLTVRPRVFKQKADCWHLSFLEKSPRCYRQHDAHTA